MASTLERSWQHLGLDCAVYGLELGHRCGYVRIPEKHPWHGISYSAQVPGCAANTLREVGSSMGAAIACLGGKDEIESYTCTLDGIISVHGGLTFSEDTDFRGRLPRGWWIGFDCGHYGDRRDPALISERMAKVFDGLDEHGHLWTLDEVVAETQHLAAQVAAKRGDYQRSEP